MNSKTAINFSQKINEIKLEQISSNTCSNDYFSELLYQSNDISEREKTFSDKSIGSFSHKKINLKYLKYLDPREKFILKFLKKIISYKKQCKDDFQFEKSDEKFRKEGKENSETYEEINPKIENLISENNKKNIKISECNYKIIQHFINSNSKYKKMYEDLIKENEKLKQENCSLNSKIQELIDEIDIMRDEDKINKELISENEEKINQFSILIKQQINIYDQKIFNYKELLFKKDKEIHRLNKKLEKININSKNIIDELKIRVKDYEEKLDKENNIMRNSVNGSSHLNVNKKCSLNNYDNNIDNINKENEGILKNVNNYIKC